MCRFQGRQNKKIAFLFYFFLSYRLADSKTFFGLKIGPLLTEIRPLLCSKVKFYINPLKTTFRVHIKPKNSSVFYLLIFFFLPTDRLGFFHIEKNSHFRNFILFLYFRPTDCTKKARERSAIQGINRAWPYPLDFSAQPERPKIFFKSLNQKFGLQKSSKNISKS